MTKNIKRLIEGFRPDHYALELSVDKIAERFKGSVVITGHKLGRPSQRLTFHQKGLTVTKAELTKLDKTGEQAINVDRINNQNSLHEVRLHSKNILYPGQYRITMHFSGKITSSMEGIYISKFQHKSQEQRIVATQFEAHHAREAFPCIDEPEAKATFDITIMSPKEDVVLSNMPITTQTTKGQNAITTFEQTPRMSTYLVAFAHGPLHGISAKTHGGVEVGVWGSLAQPKSHMQYALDEAVKILDFYTEFFDLQYPLPKLDNLALPDFDAGAMENWGLCTYREITLLSDPKNPSISGQQLVSMVVAHELSHQWFGNLVTMKWWDDLWLNESFASLMEHITLDALHPDWAQWEQFMLSDVLVTTARDIYSNIMPISVDIKDPDLIDTAFDPTVIYTKGSRVLKMLRDYIGPDQFRDGLRAYFKKHSYSNAVRDDLWSAMSSASHHDVSKLLLPWITQSGMPLVEIEQESKNLKLTQSHFMLDKPADGILWPIPLLANQKVDPDLLDKQSGAFKLASSEPVVINALAGGHYLSHYIDQKHQQFLTKGFKQQAISTEARINLLNDLLLLSRKGQASVVEALELIKGVQNEPRDPVWGQILRVIATTGQLTEGNQKIEDSLKAFRVNLAKPHYQKLGWQDKPKDNINTRQLRHTVVAMMLAGDDKSAIKIARGIIDSKQPENIDAELRPTILASTIRQGNEKLALQLVDRYQKVNVELQADFVAALSATKDNNLAKKILANALGPKGFVRQQDVVRWLISFLRNYYTRPAAWEFMENHWDWIVRAMSSSKSFTLIPTYCSGIINSKEWAKKYRTFFEPKLTDKVMANNIRIGLADIESRVAWREREESKIESFFN